MQHRVVREVAGSVSIASVGCGNLDTRLCACREERTAVSVGEISCPRSAHLQRGAVSGSSFQGAWRQASGAGGLLSFLPFSLQSMTIRQWQGRGSGGAQALVWLFVCCTRCVFGCGGELRALLHLYPLPTAAARLGWCVATRAQDACCALHISPEGA